MIKILRFTTAVVACGILVTGASAAPQDDTPPSPVQQSNSRQLTPEDYKDWRQAGGGEDGLGDQLRNHIVRTKPDGSLNGRLAVVEPATGDLTSAAPMRIKFLRDGEVVTEVTPQPDGSFTVPDFEPGVYAMIAAGRGGFVAWSVNVRPARRELASQPGGAVYTAIQQAVGALDVEAAAVPPRDHNELKRLIRRYLPDEDTTLLVEPEGIEEQRTAEPPASTPGTQLQHHQVRLSADGKLTGRIRRLHNGSGRDRRIQDLNVYLILNDDIAAQEPVAASGLFTFSDLKPGVYSLVAAGSDGFLAFSLDVVGPAAGAASLKAQPGYVPVSFNMAQGPTPIDAALVGPENLNNQNVNDILGDFMGNNQQVATAPPTSPAPAPMQTMGANTGGATGGTGGAAVGSGGSFGTLLAAGGLAAGIWAIVDDDGRRRSNGNPDCVRRVSTGPGTAVNSCSTNTRGAECVVDNRTTSGGVVVKFRAPTTTADVTINFTDQNNMRQTINVNVTCNPVN